MKLSRLDRMILSNQYRILEALYPHQADEYSRAREAIESGYTFEYERLIEHIREDGLSEEECREIREIMKMFSSLKASYNNLEDKSGIDEWRMTFHGFSGNEETSQMAYAQYLRKGGSFTELGQENDFSGHLAALSAYRKMLSEWRNSANRYLLSKDDIIRITRAWDSAAV